jgi:hypothetical protein
MVEKREKHSGVMINRAPVLTRWAAVVAEILGFDYVEALAPGRAVAGLNACSKGVALEEISASKTMICPMRSIKRKELLAEKLI